MKGGKAVPRFRVDVRPLVHQQVHHLNLSPFRRHVQGRYIVLGIDGTRNRTLTCPAVRTARIKYRGTYLRREVNVRPSVIEQGSDSIVPIMRSYVQRREAALRRYIRIVIVLKSQRQSDSVAAIGADRAQALDG